MAEKVIYTKNCPRRCIESKIEFPTNLVLCNNIVFKKTSIKIRSYLETIWMRYYILYVLLN